MLSLARWAVVGGVVWLIGDSAEETGNAALKFAAAGAVAGGVYWFTIKGRA